MDPKSWPKLSRSVDGNGCSSSVELLAPVDKKLSSSDRKRMLYSYVSSLLHGACRCMVALLQKMVTAGMASSPDPSTMHLTNYP